MTCYTLRKCWQIKNSKASLDEVSLSMIIAENMPGESPDLFAAITVFAEVPFERFAGPTPWNSDWMEGVEALEVERHLSGCLQRESRFGFGCFSTGRTIQYSTYRDYHEAIKRWTNVFEASSTAPTPVIPDPPAAPVH